MSEKEKIPRNTIVTGASLMPKHLEMIEALIEEKGYMNRSDVLRRALEFFYEKSLPDYIYKRSAKDMKARDEVKAKKEIETLTEVDFAKKFIDHDAVILPSSDGYEYLIVHGTANMLNAIRTDTIKEWFKEYPDLVELHKTKVASATVASELSQYMIQYLQRNFGILPTAIQSLIDGPHETNTNEQSGGASDETTEGEGQQGDN